LRGPRHAVESWVEADQADWDLRRERLSWSVARKFRSSRLTLLIDYQGSRGQNRDVTLKCVCGATGKPAPESRAARC